MNGLLDKYKIIFSWSYITSSSAVVSTYSLGRTSACLLSLISAGAPPVSTILEAIDTPAPLTSYRLNSMLRILERIQFVRSE